MNSVPKLHLFFFHKPTKDKSAMQSLLQSHVYWLGSVMACMHIRVMDVQCDREYVLPMHNWSLITLDHASCCQTKFTTT